MAKEKKVKIRKRKKPMSTKAKIRRYAENVILVCLVCIMAFSAWKIYNIVHEYRSHQGIYNDISSQSREGEFTGDIDFDALSQINPDVVGWIYYKDTLIDYPIVKGTNNDEYLYTMFDGTYSGFGCLFVDADTENPFKQFNTIVYGHHMKNGSMFADLKKLKNESFCNSHPRMELITPEGKFHLDIWAFLHQPADSGVYVTNISDMDERKDYMDTVQDLASYTTDIAIEPTDRLVVLSTCAYEYDEARYIVVGKLTPWEGENIDMSYDQGGSDSEDEDAETEDNTDADEG